MLRLLFAIAVMLIAILILSTQRLIFAQDAIEKDTGTNNINWNTTITGIVGVSGVTGTLVVAIMNNKYNIQRDLKKNLHE
jgi:hypothetical protein